MGTCNLSKLHDSAGLVMATLSHLFFPQRLITPPVTKLGEGGGEDILQSLCIHVQNTSFELLNDN